MFQTIFTIHYEWLVLGGIALFCSLNVTIALYETYDSDTKSHIMYIWIFNTLLHIHMNIQHIVHIHMNIQHIVHLNIQHMTLKYSTINLKHDIVLHRVFEFPIPFINFPNTNGDFPALQDGCVLCCKKFCLVLFKLITNTL